MSVALAQARAADLRTALLDNGVRRVSLELQPGVAGSGWAVDTFRRGMGHHIASYPPGTPGLGLVKAGRTGKNALTGPLCNGYGGFDLTARIITMGWANHPGAGGPWSVPGWGTVPRDDGRPRIFGWEFEGGYLTYTDEMHDFMARCGAGTLDWLGTLPGAPGSAPIECWDEHKGWAPGRKSDRIGYSTASGRTRIAAVRGTTNEEDDMGHVDDISVDALKKIRDYVWRDPQLDDGVPAIETLRKAANLLNAKGSDDLADHIWRHPQPEDRGVPILLLQGAAAGVGAMLARPGADVDETALAAALAPLLPAVAPAVVAQLSDETLQRLGEIVADVQARRLVS